MEKEKEVVIKLKGGMGNQMFQYAFGRALEHAATKAKQPIKLLFDTTAYTDPVKKDTRRPFMLSYFVADVKIASDTTALRARNPYGIISKVHRRVTQKIGIGNTPLYVPSLLKPPFKGYYEGYWQSHEYFKSMEKEIRDLFVFQEDLGTISQKFYERITADPNAVSIFYRRTDYVGDKTHDIGEQEYQQRAIARMSTLVPNMRLYVMSDDITWVKENADLPAESVFVSSPEIPPHEEMQLAAACKHHIIPNSTFAWWGAWLNPNPEKKVIAPKDWVRFNNNKYTHITPEEWLRV